VSDEVMKFKPRKRKVAIRSRKCWFLLKSNRDEFGCRGVGCTATHRLIAMPPNSL